MVVGPRKVMGTWQSWSPGGPLEEGNSDSNTSVPSPYQTSSTLPTPVLSLGNISIKVYGFIICISGNFSFHSIFFK